jgi:hypothetical protein
VSKPKARKVRGEAIDRSRKRLNKKNAARAADGVQRRREGGARRQRGGKEDQTAILNDFATCSLIGSTASAIAF